MAGEAHTIVLMQPEGLASRTYRDYTSPTKACDNMIRTYEARLKELNPSVKNISYEVSDLFAWLDAMRDLAVMLYDNETHQYQPHSRDWLKAQIFNTLKAQVGK